MKENKNTGIVPPSLCVAVDVQNDFIRGSLGSEWAAETAPKIVEFWKTAHDNASRLICTLDTHGLDYLETREGKVLPVTHCIGDSEGWKLYAGMEGDAEYPYAFTSKLEKDSFMTYPCDMENALSTQLDIPAMDLHSHNGDVFVFGFCTSICVVANALLLRGLMPEANIMVIPDLCADIDAESHAAALKVMANNHIPSVSAEKALEMVKETCLQRQATNNNK